MRKRFAIVLFATLLFSLNQAQAQEKALWKEMYAFHDVMSPSFHGAEKGDLAPLKEKAAELVASAQAWEKSPVPAGYNAELTKATLKRLTKQCKMVQKQVKKGATDQMLVTEITKAHDVFHEVMEKCRD